MLWTLFIAADWQDIDTFDLLTPETLVRESLIDMDEIRRRNYISPRLSLPMGMGEEIETCKPGRGNTLPFTLPPFKEEIGHWTAARLTPPGWPFQVTDVAYYLGEDDKTSYQVVADLTHTVALYVSSADTPPASGDPIAERTITLSDTIPGYNLVEWELSEPVVLHEGEHLYVAVQNTGDWPEVTALLTCDVDDLPGSWWSYSVDQPYSWTHLSSISFYQTPMISAEGYWIIE
jgi:hypothetical protein